jgi:hypothetical protein
MQHIALVVTPCRMNQELVVSLDPVEVVTPDQAMTFETFFLESPLVRGHRSLRRSVCSDTVTYRP